MRNKFLWVWMLFLLGSATGYAQSKALNDYISNFTNQIQKQESLTFTGSYEAGGPDIDEISLYYSSDHPQELSSARQMFLKVVNQFIGGLNQNPNLKAQLKPYPFTEQGLDIVIFFRDKKGKYASSPYIGQISMQKGVISYYKFNGNKFEVVKQESYSKAERLTTQDNYN